MGGKFCKAFWLSTNWSSVRHARIICTYLAKNFDFWDMFVTPFLGLDRESKWEWMLGYAAWLKHIIRAKIKMNDVRQM